MNRWRMGYVGVAVAALAFVLSGCASGEISEEAAAETAEIDAEVAAETAAREADLARLSALTWQEFNLEPADVKRGYAIDALLERESAHQVSLADQGTQMPNTLEYPLTGEGDVIDLDGQAILNNWNYVLEDAYIRFLDDQSLDYDEAIKTLSIAYYVTDDAGAGGTQSYVETRDRILSNSKPFKRTDVLLTVYSESPVTDAVDNSGNSTKVKDIRYTTQEGEDLSARFAFLEVDSLKDSGSWGFWLLVDVQPT